MKNMKLKDLAEIGLGYPFRRQIITNPKGEIYVVQMKDVKESGVVEWSELNRIATTELDPINGIDIKRHKYFLDPGDILFKAKGGKNNAAMLTADMGPVVASQQFLIIKVKSDIVEPIYITWFFNYLHDTGYFERKNEGTYIPFISKRAVLEINVPIPSKSEQLKIVQLHRMVKREAELMDKIKEKRKMMEQSVLGNFIKQL